MKEAKETIQQGNLRITNVPVKIMTTDGYEERFYTGYVSYKMSHIFEHMIKNGLTEYDYDSYSLDE